MNEICYLMFRKTVINYYLHLIKRYNDNFSFLYKVYIKGVSKSIQEVILNENTSLYLKITHF